MTYLEQYTLSSDLSQGYALKMLAGKYAKLKVFVTNSSTVVGQPKSKNNPTHLFVLTELMSSFLEHEAIKQKFKGKLVATVLNGYLSLRR